MGDSVPSSLGLCNEIDEITPPKKEFYFFVFI